MSLREYLFQNRMPATILAKQLGISANYLRAIKRGEYIPSLELCQMIEMMTGGKVTITELRQPNG